MIGNRDNIPKNAYVDDGVKVDDTVLDNLL